MFSSRPVLMLLCLAVCCLATAPTIAADGFMVRVTAAKGEIKLGEKVLATVPQGTRLWVFEVKDREWAKVKVPGKEEKGWLYYNQIEKTSLSATDESRMQVAYTHYQRHVNLRKSQKLAAAIPEMQACLAIVREVHGSDHPDTADGFNNLGILLRDAGDYRAARKNYDEALAIQRNVLGNSHNDTAMTLNNLGVLASDLGDYSAARKYLEESLAIKRQALGNGHSSTAMMLNNLGVLASEMGDYRAARMYYEEALIIKRRSVGNEHASTADTLNNLGVLAKELADYPAARKYYDEALAIRRKVLGNQHTSTADTLINLGVLMSNLGDYTTARKYYEESLAIQRNVLGNEHTGTADTINNLASLLKDLGNYQGARKYYEEALAIRRKVLGNAHKSTADTLNNLGLLERDLGDFPAAQKQYDEALAIYRKVLGNEHTSTAMPLNNLGILASDLGDFEAARKYYEESLAIKRKLLGNEHTDTARSLENLAWLAVEEKTPTVAAEYWQECRRAVRAHEIRTLPSLSQREQLEFLTNNHDLNWSESLSFGLAERGDGGIARLSAGWLLNGKAVAEESLAEGALLNKPEATPLVAKLRGVRGDLAKAAQEPASPARDQRLKNLQRQQEELTRELGRLRGEDRTADPWVSIEEMQTSLPAKSVLINLARFRVYDFAAKKRGPEHYVAWVIPPGENANVSIIDLGLAEPIDAAVANFRAVMAKAPAEIKRLGEKEATAALEQSLAPLVKKVWQPLAAACEGSDELIVSPDGPLWLVPWAALPIGDGQTLLEKYKIRYVTSGRELAPRLAAKTSQGAAVVMADPSFDLQPTSSTTGTRGNVAMAKSSSGSSVRSAMRLNSVERLPGTAREAAYIRPSLATYCKEEPILILKDDATEARFKQIVAPRILVLATHGFFFDAQAVVEDDKADRNSLSTGAGDRVKPVCTTDGAELENPLLRCGLLLAGCNHRAAADAAGTDDGVLTGLEVVSTDLRGTEMVVLSACETGLGTIRTGEGVAGLRQAFTLAGARTVVSTLWQIPDDETTLLMNDFMEYLSQGRSKSEAMRYAQINRIKSHRAKQGASHPFYWAAFSVTGEN